MPQDHVSGVGMSITCFRQPVHFNMGEKEPIKIIFMMCTPNNREHRELMRGCTKLFTDQHFMSALKKEAFESAEDLYGLIKIKIDDVTMLT